MLPTFVIGLREGLEAALIVGIIAAFLGQQGRKDALRQVWTGTAAAVTICIGVAIALQLISSDLPQRQQEGLETVVGALAICMVTYMVVFMRKHARSMKKDLQGAAASALAQGSSRALVMMAFLAVLREGFETAVFLLATFHASDDASTSWLGAVLGIVLAAAIGYGIYKGGVKLNMARFFRATGLVLVMVAAGLARKIRMFIENWDRDYLQDQENVIGRTKVSGAPLSGGSEFTTPDFAKAGADGQSAIPADSHVRLASPEHNGGTHILRRGYSFTDGIDPQAGTLLGGLFFIGFMKSPAQFIKLQTSLATDALNEYIHHIGSAVFAVQPGLRPGQHYGDALFA